MRRGEPKLSAEFSIDGHGGTGLRADLGEVVAEVGLQVEGQHVRRQSEGKSREQGMHHMARRGRGEADVCGSDHHGLVGGARSKRQQRALAEGLHRPPSGFEGNNMRHEHRRSDRGLLADMWTDFGTTSARLQGFNHRLRPLWRASERGGS